MMWWMCSRLLRMRFHPSYVAKSHLVVAVVVVVVVDGSCLVDSVHVVKALWNAPRGRHKYSYGATTGNQYAERRCSMKTRLTRNSIGFESIGEQQFSTSTTACARHVHPGSDPWAPCDYENWEGTLIKLGGHNINLGRGALMVKIKDFTLASQNLGARALPCPTHRAPMLVWPLKRINTLHIPSNIKLLLINCQTSCDYGSLKICTRWWTSSE